MNKIELVTEDSLETRLLECLNQRHMPDYFLYAGEMGTQNWLDLDKSDAFPIASRLTGLLRQNVPAIVRDLARSIHLVSIGVGDGVKERILLDELLKRGKPRYCAVDISSPMVDAALNAVAELDIEKTGIAAFCEDLQSIHPHWSSPILLCLLGNNFCNYEPDVLLSIISKELTNEDQFLFDCHVVPRELLEDNDWRIEVEQAYRSQPNILFNIGPLMRHGLKSDDCIFELDLVLMDTSFGQVLRTRKHIRIISDSVLKFGEIEVHLAAGETIQMGFTYKYTEVAVERLLRQYRFHVLERFVSPARDNLLILANKSTKERL